MHRRAWMTIGAIASTALVLAASAVTSASAALAASVAAAGVTPQVRVDQVGYPSGAAKDAFVMLGARATGRCTS